MDATRCQEGSTPHDHPAQLAHHFDSAPQQFEAAKLGMWLFLATELLLFGGLFCLYAVYRGNHPEIFEYGSQFLDTTWGAINTTVLILSSVTMALAVWSAQRDRQRQLVLFLLLTLLFAGDFLLIKYIEYSHKIHENLVWGLSFYETPAAYEPTAVSPPPQPAQPWGPDAAQGRERWMATCRTCHGIRGEGIPGQGKDIRGSKFIAGKTNEELLAFIKVGRLPSDPLNTTGIQMPPRGGNPLLDDEDLLNIIARIHTFEGFGKEAPVAAADGSDTQSDTASGQPQAAFWIPKSLIPPATIGPVGLTEAYLGGEADSGQKTQPEPLHHTLDPNRPANAHMFFGIYFLMTGLHGLHVLAGVGVIGWLLIRASKGHFNGDYYTPLDLGGLYWHVVDIIWIFLFPLFYLIR